MQAIYADIDRLAPAKLQTLSWRPKLPLFQWPLGAAVVLALLLVARPAGWRANGAAEGRCAMHEVATIPFHLLRPLVAFRADAGRGDLGAGAAGGRARGAMGRRDRAASAATPDRQAGPGRGHQPVYLVAAGMALGIVALSGPTWRRELPPFVEDKAPLMIALAVALVDEADTMSRLRASNAPSRKSGICLARAPAREAG